MDLQASYYASCKRRRVVGSAWSAEVAIVAACDRSSFFANFWRFFEVEVRLATVPYRPASARSRTRFFLLVELRRRGFVLVRAVHAHEEPAVAQVPVHLGAVVLNNLRLVDPLERAADEAALDRRTFFYCCQISTLDRRRPFFKAALVRERRLLNFEGARVMQNKFRVHAPEADRIENAPVRPLLVAQQEFEDVVLEARG